MQPEKPTAGKTYDFSMLRDGIVDRNSNAGSSSTLLFIVAAIFVLGVMALVPTMMTSNVSTAEKISQYFPFVVLGGFFLVIIIIIGAGIERWRYITSRSKFVMANQLNLLDVAEMPIPESINPASVTSQQTDGCALDINNTKVTLFDYQYTVPSGLHYTVGGDTVPTPLRLTVGTSGLSFGSGSGASRDNRDKTYYYGIAMFQLDKSYPHLFLDGRSNGKNEAYAGSQKVKLEGDFNDYFDLYIPDGSSAGALTVFSPDVMQTIMNTGQKFDIEIKGNTVWIISTGRAFSLSAIKNLLTCAGALTSELKELDRSWQPVLTASGKAYELKKRSNIWAVGIALLAYAAYLIIANR